MKKKCCLCGTEYETSDYICPECRLKMVNAKKISMVDKASKKLAESNRNVDISVATEKLTEKVCSGECKFSSIPEVCVAIQLENINLAYVSQKKIGKSKVDFYIPELRIFLEIDGGIYHQDENKAFIRDRQIMHIVGEHYEIVHISDYMVPKYTWNLRDGLNYIVAQRNWNGYFRDSSMDDDYLMESNDLGVYLNGKERYYKKRFGSVLQP